MSFKNPKKLIVVGVVVAALLAGTVLLGGYAISNAAVSDTEAPVKACQATESSGCCPAKANAEANTAANSTVFALVSGEVQTATDSSGTPSTTDCPKPCCADENAEGCDNPCPKPCCAEDGPKGCGETAGATGCPMTAAKTAAE